MLAEHEEHERESDEEELDVEFPWHRRHICGGKLGDCSNISESLSILWVEGNIRQCRVMFNTVMSDEYC